MKKEGIGKKAQLTIFIILAIMIVCAVILFLILKEDMPIPIIGDKEINPNSFFESCLEEKIRETIDLISSQGGYINNSEGNEIIFKFEGEDDFSEISYLCYTPDFYLTCINQEPMLIQHLKNEIETHISNDVKSCFNDLVGNLEKQSYEIDEEYNRGHIELVPGKIILNIEGNLTTIKTNETSNIDNPRVIFLSKFYDLVVVAQEITNQEARFCNFEQLGFMLIYPEFEIDKFNTGDLTTIYTIKHRKSGEKFRFAVRSCAIPPGIG